MKVIDGLDLANQQLKNLADASSSTDAVTLQQLQAYVRGLDWKASVRASSTTNATLSAPGTSIDGVTLAANDRVLLKNQTAGAENGIYVFHTSSTALTRAVDADTGTLSAGIAVLVTEGTTGADKAWVLVTDDPITVGTTVLTFNQFGGSSSYTAGDGISITGSAISVQAVSGGGISVVAGGIQLDYTKAATKYSANVGNGTLTTISVTHGLGTSDVHAALQEVSSKEIVGIKFTVTDSNTISMVFPTAPTTSQYRITVIA